MDGDSLDRFWWRVFVELDGIAGGADTRHSWRQYWGNTLNAFRVKAKTREGATEIAEDRLGNHRSDKSQ